MKFTINLFGQILQIVSRLSFVRLVHKCRAERHAKGFSSCDQYVAMLFCQMDQSKNLRKISHGLAVTWGKLSHLGLYSAPAMSTLSCTTARSRAGRQRAAAANDSRTARSAMPSRDAKRGRPCSVQSLSR